jgi:hypothetical protein
VAEEDRAGLDARAVSVGDEFEGGEEAAEGPDGGA